MRTTLSIDDELIERARRMTGEKETAVLIRLALRVLIEREAAGRLAAQAGSMPRLRITRRRRATDKT
jgi:Arc/MetJ family transcription regulator